MTADPADGDAAGSDRTVGTVGTVDLLTNHGHVLLALHRNPDLLQREIADLVGITEGRVNGILADLQSGGYIQVERIGRRNHYLIDGSRSLRHPIETGHRVEEILERLGPNGRSGPSDIIERSTAA